MSASILDRIRKLFSHANSAGQLGSQAEAELFAAKANELLIQHKLDIAMLDFADDTPEELVDMQQLTPDFFGTKKVTGWRSVLLAGIAKAHFCRTVRLRNKSVALIGTPSDRAVVLYILDQLLRVAPAMAVKAVPTPLTWGARSTIMDRNGWLLGFAVGVSEALGANRKRAEGVGSALVVINRAQALVDTKTRELYPNTTKSRGPGTRSAAYDGGLAAGRAHKVSGGVGGPRGTAGRVPGATLRLGSGS